MILQGTCVALFVFSASLLWLAASLHRGIPPGDAGELLTCCATFAVPHPPGYPLMLLLYHWIEANITSHLWGRPQSFHGVSAILGAVCCSCTSSLVFSLLASSKMIVRVGASFVVSVLFLRSQVVLTYFTETEVFAMHYCNISLLMWLFWRYEALRDNGVTWPLYGAALCCGTMLSNQQFGLLAALPVSGMVVFDLLVAKDQTLLRFGEVFCFCSLLIAFGMLPYAALLYIARADPENFFSWGGTESVEGLLNHIFRTDYGTLQLHSGRGMNDESAANVVAYNRAFAHFVLLQLPLPLILGAVALAVMSFWVLIRNLLSGTLIAARHRYVVRLTIAFVFQLISFHALSNIPLGRNVFLHVYERFWGQFLLPLSVFGVVFFVEGISLLPKLHIFAVAALTAVLFLSEAFAVSDKISLEAQHVYKLYAESALSSLPQNALLITAGDYHLTSIRAMQGVFGLRKDILHIDRELFWYSWARRALSKRRDFMLPSELEDSKENVFSNVALIARDNLIGFQDAARHRRRFFVLDCPDVAKEEPNFKTFFSSRVHGWFYEILPPNSSLPSSKTCRKLRRAAAEGEGAVTHLADVYMSQHGALSGFAAKLSPVLLNASFARVSRSAPWQALILQHYHTARKNALLQLSIDLQNCVKAMEEQRAFGVALKTISGVVKKELRIKFFESEEMWRSIVGPFADALEQSWKHLRGNT